MDGENIEGNIARVAYFSEIVDGNAMPSDNYKGIPIFAYNGLHEHAAALMERQGLLSGSIRVLEVGCGAGGMSQRLADHGLSVLALDAVPSNFRASGTQLENRFADLNGRFDAGLEEAFDLVVAMEIIEHLEAPRAFLRSCCACLKPGGRLFLTMPNVDSSYAIVSLALQGAFVRFDNDYLRRDGHIMPLTRHQFLAAAHDAGLELEHEEGFGLDWMSRKSWPRFWLLMQLIRRLRSGANEGVISEYILRRRT